MSTFQEAIRASGLEPPERIEPGKLHRFPGVGKGKGNTSAWCKLFPDGTGGVYGDFSSGLESTTWQAKQGSKPMSALQRQRLAAQQALQRETEEQEKIRQKEKALKAWQSASPVTTHPYLSAKGIKAYGLRTDGRNLLIPLQDSHGAFQGYQWIGERGHKGFAKGSPLQGSYFLLGEPHDGLTIAEGYATAASLYEATGQAVVVAFNSGNLKLVAEALRQQYPEATITVAADNDQWTEGNPGRRAGKEAAEAIRGTLIYPTFTEKAIAQFKDKHGKGPTDFNDLHQTGGITEVEKQINNKVNENEIILNQSATSATSAIFSHKIRATEDTQSATHPLLPLPNPLPKPLNPLPGQDKQANSSFGDPCSGGLVEEGKGGPKLVIASRAAREIAQVLSGQFAYDAESGVWHTFTGSVWQPEETPITLHKQLTHWLYAETEPVGFTPRYMDSALLIIQRAGMLSLPKQHGLIPFANGLLNPVTRELVKTTPDNALTWCLPSKYQPHADCPAIKSWLHEMTGDQGTVQLLRGFMAAVLRKPAKYQKFLHLVGPGGTGKSTFIRLLQLLVGEQNTVSTDLRQLEQNRFEAASLYGKRLAMITDSDKYGGSINVLKALTGQDPIRLERKHVQQAGSFIFEGLVVMASNEALTTTDYTSGLERRRMTVPFEKCINDQAKQRWNENGGEAQLYAEIPGLVNWLLDMPLEEIERVITHPPVTVANANIEAMRDGNPAADWVMENCIPAYGAWTQIGNKREFRDQGVVFFACETEHLYPNYLQWCRQNGREPLAIRRFSPNVVDALRNCLSVDVMKTHRKGLKGIQGIRLKEQGESAHEWLKINQV